MSASLDMAMSIQTVMLLERVPVFLNRLTVTDPSFSLTKVEVASNCMITSGAISRQTKNTINEIHYTAIHLFAYIIS